MKIIIILFIYLMSSTVVFGEEKKECSETIPMIKEIKPGRMVACHLY